MEGVYGAPGESVTPLARVALGSEVLTAPDSGALCELDKAPRGRDGVKLLSVPNARELGRYVSADGERSLRAVRSRERSRWSLIDVRAEGARDARLIEPAVDSLAQAEAIARDYLPRAHRARRPLRRQPTPDPA